MPIYDLSSDFDLLRRNLTLVAALARALITVAACL